MWRRSLRGSRRCIMGIAEEEKLLEKLSKDFRKMNATELSKMIKMAPAEQRALLEKPYREKMRLATQAEEFLKQGRLNQALEMLNHAMSLGHFGNEYPYGLLGDIYIKRGEKAKAYEMYNKSGSIDSLKKIKRYGLGATPQ